MDNNIYITISSVVINALISIITLIGTMYKCKIDYKKEVDKVKRETDKEIEAIKLKCVNDIEKIQQSNDGEIKKLQKTMESQQKLYEGNKQTDLIYDMLKNLANAKTVRKELSNIFISYIQNNKDSIMENLK